MKKVIYVTLLIGMISGCGPTDEEIKVINQHVDSLLRIDNMYPLRNSDQSSVTVVWLDGCEYIKVGLGNHTWGCHKGDCKNPIHIYNK